MAKLVLTNTSVTLNGTDVSSSVAAITISTSAAEVPTTNFGSGGAVTRVSGLIDNSVTMSMHNDYNSIDGLIFPLVGSTAVTMVVKASTAAVSTANQPMGRSTHQWSYSRCALTLSQNCRSSLTRG